MAQPDYRKIFAVLSQNKPGKPSRSIPASRLHLAEDRTFFYSNSIDSNSEWENNNIAIAFQREVSHQIIPRVQPDLIHCHDWMTGLIPAMARQWGIPCLYTIKNLRTSRCLLSTIEDRGIDGAAIWQDLFYARYPSNYEETRNTNPFDFLLSGILTAQHINFSDPALQSNIAVNQNDVVYMLLEQVLSQKRKAGCVCGIPVANSSYKPSSDGKVYRNYGPTALQAKKQRASSCDPGDTAQGYIDLYEQVLQRSLINPQNIKIRRSKITGPKKKFAPKGFSSKVPEHQLLWAS